VTRGARLVILGKQGAGKGTQGERLSRHFKTQHLSTGQLFRDSAAVGVPAGLKAKEFMDRGELVPDEIVVDVVAERFSNPAEVQDGFVLDGFPRTENQAEELDRILGERFPLDLVIDLDVPTDMAIERLLGRGREDDTRESIRRRLELYDQETKPLCDLYRKRKLLTRVDGVGEEDEVFQRLLNAIDSYLDPVTAAEVS
jgi:adenylate kinase